jgi:hypothetical protein
VLRHIKARTDDLDVLLECVVRNSFPRYLFHKAVKTGGSTNALECEGHAAEGQHGTVPSGEMSQLDLEVRQ